MVSIFCTWGLAGDNIINIEKAFFEVFQQQSLKLLLQKIANRQCMYFLISHFTFKEAFSGDINMDPTCNSEYLFMLNLLNTQALHNLYHTLPVSLHLCPWNIEVQIEVYSKPVTIWMRTWKGRTGRMKLVKTFFFCKYSQPNKKPHPIFFHF